MKKIEDRKQYSEVLSAKRILYHRHRLCGEINDGKDTREKVCEKIAAHFGYKLSLHSGSYKFSVFPTVVRVTGGHVHVKTAGTSWLEALAVLAEADPALYRRAQEFAVIHRSEAEKYYRASSDVLDSPDIDLENDAYLPEYLRLPASRQTMHI